MPMAVCLFTMAVCLCTWLCLNAVVVQAVFAYFDMDNDGVISKKEWMHGCDLLNAEVEDHMKVDGAYAASDSCPNSVRACRKQIL